MCAFMQIKHIHNDQNRTKIDPMLVEEITCKFRMFQFEHQEDLQQLVWLGLVRIKFTATCSKKVLKCLRGNTFRADQKLRKARR